MYTTESHRQALMENYRLGGWMMRYSVFMPKLYNLCKSLGFEAGKILPSRAFCSDESQGFPIILIAKHFGTFPFNHGLVGGVVATDRHGPHAAHGKDMVIIQASHVGYDPETGSFGVYRRLQTEDKGVASCCGKIESVIDWYRAEYQFARDNIFVEPHEGEYWLVIDNQLLNEKREEGIYLHLDELIELDPQQHAAPLRALSTAKCFRASAKLREQFAAAGVSLDRRQALGDLLAPDWFHFERPISGDEEGHGHMEQNLQPAMPWILTSGEPLLEAAKVNTQVEFDRAFRTIVKDSAYRNKRVLYVAGLNIDISPQPGQLFPLTKFVPWAAYIQRADNTHYTLEQDELFRLLDAQSAENPDQIDLESAIRSMSEASEIRIPVEW
ncbi:MAG: hypothetical protein J5I92_09990 [Thiogranum sp.]|nr:hypothetical protein [Thiogranum sp.]